MGHFFFFCLRASVTLRGGALGVPGPGNTVCCAVMLYVGEGPRGSNGASLTLLLLSIFHADTHNQTGPLWCWFPSGWVCAHSRPLWVSPTTSPVRLGVSPAAAPTPTGVFNHRFEALFPPSWSPGLRGLLRAPPLVRFIGAQMWCCGVLPVALPAPFSPTLSPALWVYVCECGASGSASARTACTLCPTLRQSQSCQRHASPLHPSAGLSPSYRSG